MEKIKEVQANSYSSNMKLGFGFLQVQDLEPFRNFLEKIDVDEKNEKLYMTFTKFKSKTMIFDFKYQLMTFPFNQQKKFDKFVTVTYEYCNDCKSVLIKTIRYNKKKLEKGIKYINVENLKDIKLINFLNIYSDNYIKTSNKLIENNSNYIIPIPDFYKPYLTINN